MGNPLNDGRWTYTWEHGRQLASITDGSTTVDYVYNADGLRTQKTVTTSNSHTHVFQNTVVAPTCTENGHTRHVCSCGYIYQDTPVAATGHTYTTSVVADTCTTNGYTLYTCSCGYSYQDGAPGHTFTTLVVAPTETVNGFTQHECECGYSYQSAPVASLASGASSGESGTTEVAVYDYVYNGSSLTQLTVTSGEDDAETLYFAYDGSSPMAVTYGGATYYYATNLQGDVIAILNSSGTAVVQYTYDAWGNILTTTGSMASTLGAINPLTYRGYVFDRETGLYYLQSRYYNPEVGRFINADAFASTGQGFIGNNMFAYCLNNPISYVDSTGTLTSAPEGPQMVGQIIGEIIGWWLKELIEDEQDTIESGDITYSSSGVENSGARISDSYKLKTTIYKYEYLFDNRGKEVKGSTTGMVYEWTVHNLVYAVAEPLSDCNIPLIANVAGDLAGRAESVDFGKTIWADFEDRGLLSLPMLIPYVVISPRLAVFDLIVQIVG